MFKIFKKLSGTLYAPRCIVCDSKANLIYDCLCRGCYNSINFLSRNVSVREKRGYKKIWSLAAHEGAWLEIIHRFKYEKRTDADPLIEAILNGHIPAFDGIDAIVPIPLDRWRYLMRGYNQSMIIARMVSKMIKKPVLSGVIKRRRRRPRQVGLDLNKRVANIKGVFCAPLSSQFLVKGRSLLLVDDVVTSGSTVSEAANTLKKAGAVSVDVLTLAKTL